MDRRSETVETVRQAVGGGVIGGYGFCGTLAKSGMLSSSVVTGWESADVLAAGVEAAAGSRDGKTPTGAVEALAVLRAAGGWVTRQRRTPQGPGVHAAGSGGCTDPVDGGVGAVASAAAASGG
jgi:hypothetical protein